MKLSRLKIHNVRSVKDADIHLAGCSMMIGANNAGKSNIITALRLFYENENLKYSKERDFCRFKTDDQESWVELEFTTTDSEQEQLKDDYKSDDNILRVCRFFASEEKDRIKSKQSNIFAYEEGKLSKNLFYGAKNVSEAKLGSVIYIPAISKTDDTLKVSGPSPFRDLVNLVMKKAVSNTDSFNDLRDAFLSFNDSFRGESATDGMSINDLVTDINEELKGWDIESDIEINPIKPEDMVKHLLNQYFKDTALGGERIDVNSYGHGLQRHLIYSLIKLSARYKKSTSTKTKGFNPDFTLLLFEEPEVCLHPTQQDVLSHNLQEFSKDDTQQVLLTSHSPHFVSKKFDDITSVINVRRNDGVSKTWQIQHDELNNLLNEDVGLHRKICHSEGKAVDEDGKIKEEAIRYFLYLDAERSALFFAKHVVICEGQTEKALFNYLLDNKWTDLKSRQIYFLDSIGKYNIHRFMGLLEQLGIPHSVLYDSDQGKNKKHKVVNQFIEDHRNNLTMGTHSFDNDLEKFLGVDKPKSEKRHMRPINVVRACMKNKIEQGRIDELRKIIDSIIDNPKSTHK